MFTFDQSFSATSRFETEANLTPPLLTKMDSYTGLSQPPPMKRPPPQARYPLSELTNAMPELENDDPPAMELKDEIRALIQKERWARGRVLRDELTEEARLEMQLQNINIKKNSAERREDSTPHRKLGSPLSPSVPSGPRTCERPERPDGSIVYEFGNGLPGGVCVFFMKGYCGLGSKCRYVHDSTDIGNIVKITGMPYVSTVDQVIEFFKPLELTADKVSFTISREGKHTGSAFVEFKDRKDALLALAKDRHFFLDPTRFVLLYPSSKIERTWYQNNPLPFSFHSTPAAARNKTTQQSSPCATSTPGSRPVRIDNLSPPMQQQQQQQQQ
eukprot:Sspe_Gene.74917::Locus_46820_Transcript_1_2_Confidence_0.667_Length_1046::g.74917::m.74917